MVIGRVHLTGLNLLRKEVRRKRPEAQMRALGFDFTIAHAGKDRSMSSAYG